MTRQLALNIELSVHHTLENFYPGANRMIIDYLKKNYELQTYLWGEQGVGKTHLLQACCHAFIQQGLRVAYIPLQDYKKFSPEILNGLEKLDLVCLDDIQAVLAKTEWEEALFHCYNKLRENSAKLITAANAAPKQLTIQLQDLQSRLEAGVIFQIKPLTDEEKLIVLQMAAKAKGLELSDEVAKFLLLHCERGMAQLFAILMQLDKASLTEQRKLTIPFVKTILST